MAKGRYEPDSDPELIACYKRLAAVLLDRGVSSRVGHALLTKFIVVAAMALYRNQRLATRLTGISRPTIRKYAGIWKAL